jgi:hypothetical protein
MAIKIVLKRLPEGEISNKINLKEGGQVSCLDSEIVSVDISVRCKSCKEKNILTAESFEVVESHEREMGAESCHSSHADGECVECKKHMELKIDLWEYPVGALLFEKDFIEEIENCEYIEDSK